MNDQADSTLKTGGKLTAHQILLNPKVEYKEPLEGVHMALVPIGGCAWVDTDDGVVLIDSLVDRKPVAEVPDRIQGKIKYIIYTHGHLDHVGGAHYFMDHKPEVIASQYLPDRLRSMFWM